MTRVKGTWLALAAWLIAVPPAWAFDPLVEGARLCTQQFPGQEQAHGIPTHLLAAISSVESGRWHDQLGLPLPWPWTINVEGKGYYFDSKAEAVAKTAAFIRSGVQSIDVGCMQVNLKHHPHAFGSLEEAFDPAHNVAYGAQFLRSNYDDLGDWIKATAAYHSRTNKLGAQYLVQIEKSWNRIVGKVQQARARQGMQPQQIAQQDFHMKTPMPEKASTTRGSSRSRETASAETQQHRIAGTQHLRVIKVSDRTPQNGDVLVIRPASAPAVKVADATSSESEMMVKGDSIRSVAIDSAAHSANNGHESSTHFVFAN